MTRFLKNLAPFGLLLLVLSGCEKSFTPKGAYADKLVVYGVLSNRSDTQYVRVYTTFDVAGYNPMSHELDGPVRGADVVVSGGGQPFRFRETVVPRSDKNRYGDDLVAYHAHPFQLVTGGTYSLTVLTQQFGDVTSSVVVPKRGRVQFLNTFVLSGYGSKDENIVVYGWVRELTYGVIARLYVMYEVLEGNVWVRHLEEVPSAMIDFPDGTKVYFYPSLQRRQTSGLIPDKEVNETFVFSSAAYFDRLGLINARHPVGNVRVRQALAILTQVDQNLYTYTKVVNGFEDSYSIRTDSPDYTNINGGRGIFGAMVEDSLWVDLIVR